MPKEAPPPVLLAILVCDTVIEDRRTNKKSLIGLFDRITAAGLPVEHPSLHLFVSLTNGHGVAEGMVRVVHSETEEVLTELSGPIEFPDPMTVVEMDFGLHELVFPREGEYRFQLFCNGVLLGERRFVVVVDPDAFRNEFLEEESDEEPDDELEA